MATATFVKTYTKTKKLLKKYYFHNYHFVNENEKNVKKMLNKPELQYITKTP